LFDKPNCPINQKPENPFIQSIKATFKGLWEIFRGFLVLLIIAFIVRYVVIQPFVVDGPSMQPNFQDKEYLLVNKTSFLFSSPARNNVIIFKYPLDPSLDFIKRIIGLPYEHLEIKDGQVYINGTKLDEKYLQFGQKTSVGDNAILDITLKKDEYFVMGDNRSGSSDSRAWGTVPKINIIGKAWFAVVPFSYFGLIK